LELSWRRAAGDQPESLSVWSDLVQRWSEPHRRYHSLGHLAAVLGIVDAYAGLATDPDAVRLAAWYHDAIYDPTRLDNEERSAQLAESELAGLGLSAELVSEVARLVRLTATHAPAADDHDGALLCDADLAILAAPAEAYVGYVNAVRAEYAQLSDELFRTGRSQVLRSLLDRPAIFTTVELRELFEEAARRNVTAELQLLSKAP
jgi:predicted metal-dependent HD superfamily phosphohydrolase